MRWIYLSPHLDDAVLSAGGLIREQTQAGIAVEIWTTMCGFPPEGEISPLAQALHYMWGFASAAETIQGRRDEDDLAAGMLGATTAHFDFLDCIYRGDAEGNWLYPEDVCVPPAPGDAGLPSEIARAVSTRLLADDVVVAQFGIGRHVDHTLVRRAAEQLGHPLWYDADIPYLFNHPDELVSAAAGMKPTRYPVSEANFRPWWEAVLAYSSQISSLFESQEALQAALEGYWKDKGGIDLWRPEK